MANLRTLFYLVLNALYPKEATNSEHAFPKKR